MVAIPGGEPLIHREIGEIVGGLVARKKFVSLCTNALLLEKKLHLFKPSPYLFFTIHLDGVKDMHDKSVVQAGVFEIAVDAIKKGKAEGFAVNVNMTVYDGQTPDQMAAFMDLDRSLGVGVSISPGYAYERAPDQEHFLARRKTKELFRSVLAMGKGRGWQSHALAALSRFPRRQPAVSLHPVGHADAQRVRLAEALLSARRGIRPSFKELMETTNWDNYGTGRYEKCANCMAHCGYEPTAADAAFSHPLATARVGLFRRPDRRPDGPGDPACFAATGRIRLFPSRRGRSSPNSVGRKAASGEQGDAHEAQG